MNDYNLNHLTTKKNKKKENKHACQVICLILLSNTTRIFMTVQIDVTIYMSLNKRKKQHIMNNNNQTSNFQP